MPSFVDSHGSLLLWIELEEEKMWGMERRKGEAQGEEGGEETAPEM